MTQYGRFLRLMLALVSIGVSYGERNHDNILHCLLIAYVSKGCKL